MRHSQFLGILLLLSFFSVTNLSYAQQAPRIEWQRCLGGSREEDRGDNVLQSIAQTSDGGYIVCGYTISNDGDVSGLHDTINGDMWVIKLSTSGSIQWQKCLGGSSGNSEALCIIQTSDKGYAVAGSTVATNGDVSGWHPGYDTALGFNFPNGDAWFVKLDSSGNIQWQKCLGGSGEDGATSILQTSDGSYIITGYTSSNDGDISGNHGSNSDEFVMKLSSSGKILWQKCYGGSGGDWAESIIQTSDGGYITAGYTDTKDEGFFNHGEEDVYIVKLDSIGKLQWQKCYGGSSSDRAYGIVQTSDNGYVFVSTTQSSDGEVTGFHLPGYSDAWVVKIDSVGKIVWGRSCGGSSSDVGLSIIQPSGGGFLIAGGTSSFDGDVLGFHGGEVWSGDVWIFQMSSLGMIEWQECLGGTSDDEAYAIIQTTDGGFAVSGRTSSPDGDVSGIHLPANGGSPLPDIWVVKLSPAIEKVENFNADEPALQAYPNPSSNEMRLHISSELIPKKLQFFDVMGAELFPEYRLENTIATINVQSLSSGIYMARIGVQSAQFVVQH